MNETIGEKGGKNDRRRSMIIKREKKRKLQQLEQDRELTDLEKKVRKKQFFTLIKALPIVVSGGFIKAIYDTSRVEKDDKVDLEEENSKWKIKEYDADITDKTPIDFEVEKNKKRIIKTPTGGKVVVYIAQDNIRQINYPEADKTPEEITDNDKKSSVGAKFLIQKEQKNNDYDVTKDGVDDLDFLAISDDAREEIGRVRTRKIIDEYDKKLKDIRYELRHVIYEYNVLVTEDDKIVLTHDAEVILDKLSDVIEKIDELKSRIKIDNVELYNDNYIQDLIDGYLDEFKEKKVISEIKDSPLYIMLAEKLDELDSTKERFSQNVKTKKEALQAKEISFEKLKDKYYSIDSLNKQLAQFQKDQEKVLAEVREKVKNSMSETEKTMYEFQALNMEGHRLRRFMAFQMFMPGALFAKGLAASAATYLLFMRNIMRPKVVERKYKVINVEDYSDQIQGSIDSVNDAINSLDRTQKQIDKMLAEIMNKYKDYIGVVSECDDMIRNLRKIRGDLEEKEYEMDKIKYSQQLELEKNNAKVLKRGSYPVN